MKTSTAFVIATATVLAACGGAGTSGSPPAARPFVEVSGVASDGAPLSGPVVLRDSASPSAELTAISDGNGWFAFDVSGLKPPFVVSTDSRDGGKYASASEGGRTNVNPVTDAAVRASGNAFDEHGLARIHQAVNKLQTMLRSCSPAMP